MVKLCKHERGKRLFIYNTEYFDLPLKDVLVPMTEFFLELGMTSRNYVSMMVQRPGIMRMDLEKEIKPRIEYLISVGCSRKRICELLPIHLKLLYPPPNLDLSKYTGNSIFMDDDEV